MTYYFSDNPNGFATGKRFSIDRPAVTIMAAGMGGDSLGHWHIMNDGIETGAGAMSTSDKPEYRVPLLSEIRKIKPNGLTVASFFAGAGGSSTGYRMAGFKVLYANEFVPIAQESYRANAASYTVVDGRDVRQVTAADVLEACKLKRGELDVLDGSPPCQAFSTAGKREKGWGTEKRYEHGASQKNEDLFFEFIRIRDGMMPLCFVAENVSGLVKGTAKGYFIEILKRLKVGYRVVAPLLDAQWLGVPQARQRIVFIGVREDLDVDPPVPSPLPYRYSVRDALPWIGRAIHDTRGQPQYSGGDITGRPSVSILAGAAHMFFAEDKVVHDPGRGRATDISDRPSPTITAGPDDAAEGGGPRNHFKVEVRKIANGDSVAENVAATLEGYAIGEEWDRLNPGEQSKRFFSLVKADPSEPCPTITAMGVGGEKSGVPGGTAAVVHPTEKRKFTILEVKRLCSFPDDFVLKGTYGQQWERLGNSVPPLMMRAVAEGLRDRVLLPARSRPGKSRSRGKAKPLRAAT